MEEFIQKQQTYLNNILTSEGKENVFEIKNRMKEIMGEKVGIFRDGTHLKEAVDELEQLYIRSQNIAIKTKRLEANPELEEAYRVPKMLKIALCVAKGALDRTESRGAHSREDYPKRDDVNWLKRTLASWEDPNQTLPTLTYESLDIATMEIAPGFRGYGAKGMIIENPESLRRQEEIDKIRSDMEAQGKDRYAIQEALMPFDLQAYYKTRNERIGDKQ